MAVKFSCDGCGKDLPPLVPIVDRPSAVWFEVAGGVWMRDSLSVHLHNNGEKLACSPYCLAKVQGGGSAEMH